MSPHTLKKTGTCHADKQWKVEGGKGGEKPLIDPHEMLLLPAIPIKFISVAGRRMRNQTHAQV